MQNIMLHSMHDKMRRRMRVEPCVKYTPASSFKSARDCTMTWARTSQSGSPRKRHGLHSPVPSPALQQAIPINARASHFENTTRPQISQTMSDLGFNRGSCTSKAPESSGTPAFVCSNAKVKVKPENAERLLCRCPCCTARQSSCEHAEGTRRLMHHSSTMVHLSSTPASSSLCPHSRSGRCRSTRNPASDSQTHHTGLWVGMAHCRLGKSTKAHPAHPRTSSSNPWRYIQLRRSPKIRSPDAQTLRHRIEVQGSVRAQGSEQAQGSVVPAGHC